MVSSAEVLRAVAAIVSAFQTAADTLETVRDREEKKKRKREKEFEELLEIKILLKSLVERQGAAKCRKHCENRHKQFGAAFEGGDVIAIPALKDVAIALQTEVMQALHLARAVESAILDFTKLHESSLTCRTDATRAMDQLCQRIMASMQYQPHQFSGGADARNPSLSVRSDSASLHPSFSEESVEPFSASMGGTRQPDYQRALPPLPQRTLTASARHTNDAVRESRYHAPPNLPQDWAVRQSRQTSIQSQHLGPAVSIRSGPSSISGEDQLYHRDVEDPDVERMSELSAQDSALGSEKHMELVSTISMYTLNEPRRSFVRNSPTLQQYQEDPQPGMTATGVLDIVPAMSATPSGGEIGGPRTRSQDTNTSSTSSRRTTTRSSYTPRTEKLGEHMRVLDAPEVVPKEFEISSSLPQVVTPQIDRTSDKFLAYRTQADYEESLVTLPRGLDNVWTPLPRPAMHNRYHGFCRGAWQTRKAVHDGLVVQMTPALRDPVLHWACRVCKFRLRAPNADALPDQILFNQKYSVRYRYLFLAKSHCSTETPSVLAEDYKYGCIFCAAQGQTTAVHEKLEHLMLHIVSKHKTTMITPETRTKTRCLVGGMTERAEDWDIHIPVSTQKGAGVAADEFFVSASKFFSRKQGKR
ncbi:hypothetical protein LTR53_007861 [Teratosphaeriaceae sp. CCFEE 6253]|nr:hypothetical protein LTR53_007861 [Teratosphaeriaceae sp. CCFEE 6253]